MNSTETGDAAEGEAPEEHHPQKAEDKDSSADIAIAQVVKEKIRAWKDVDITQIEVKEVSGCGGSKTFRVSICEAFGASEGSVDVVPAAIAFHSRSEFNKPLLEERNIAAGRAFANAGIGPRLIAEDEDFRWCINEWGGEAIVEKFTGPGCRNEAMGVAAVEQNMTWSQAGAGEFREQVGQVLGRIHRVPTDWAEPFLAQKPFLLSDKFPTLGCLGQKALHKQSLEDMPPQMQERWGRAIDMLNTSTALARRVVTLHADFHCGNILIHDGRSVGVEKAEPRLCAIDFEFANIGQAEFDLGYAFVVNKALLNNAANKRAFIKGYVEAVTVGSSDHVSPNDVENLLVDCEMASVKAWPPGEFIGVPDTDADTFEALVRRLAEFCSFALVPADPLKEMHAANLREELLEKGAFALIREWHQS
eukprot:CAMPEP_0180779220 /NCGR_PEP_ID=MMETSP1038_2-20121128/46264_1 /TAXON_ID=632150 /ORGANISM="Azadinium spinosum, Strain 3D9" /LENGTH=418 /DNA_ID=CAMNT_0022814487 /DNA_START=1 /DNA_END=1257 /DNA_ORIENTATION=+